MPFIELITWTPQLSAKLNKNDFDIISDLLQSTQSIYYDLKLGIIKYLQKKVRKNDKTKLQR